jgi:hypothetical protein
MNQQVGWTEEGLATTWKVAHVGLRSLMMAPEVIDQVSFRSKLSVAFGCWAAKWFIFTINCVLNQFRSLS